MEKMSKEKAAKLNKIVKRELVISSLTIIGVVIAFFGASYAYFLSVSEGNIGDVEFGELGISMCMDPSCDTGNNDLGTVVGGMVYPMNDTEGLSQTPYKFIVSNSGCKTMYLTIFVSKNTADDFDYSNIKVAIQAQGEVNPTITHLTNTVTVLKNMTLAGESNKIISVYAWIDEQAPNSYIGESFEIFINAVGSYHPEDENNLNSGAAFMANVGSPLIQNEQYIYTGTSQSFEALVGGYYFIEAWGAEGGSANANVTSGKGGLL